MKVESINRMKRGDFDESPLNRCYSYKGIVIRISYYNGYYSYYAEDDDELNGKHFESLLDLKTDVADKVYDKYGK